MTAFTRQSTRPMSPQSYEAAARQLDDYARKLRARKSPQTPREQASLTSAIHGLSLFAQALSRRHRGHEPARAIDGEVDEYLS